MAGNVVSNVKKYYGGQVPVPGQGDSDGKVKMLVEKTATIEIGGVQTEVELLYDADDLTTPVTPQQLGQWTDENYLIAFKKREDEGVVRGFILYALETDSTSTDTLVNRATFVNFKEDMNDPGASAYVFDMVEDSSTLTRYLRDSDGELIVKFNQATVEAGAQSGTLHELIDTDTTQLYFEVVHEDGKSYLRLNTEGLGGILDEMNADIEYIIGALDELPSDEHGYFNSSLYTTPGDGTTTNIAMDDFRISEGRDVSGENIEFVPTHQEGGVDFGNVYLEPGTYILAIQYTLQWVGNPRGTFLPKVCSVADQPFDFSYEHEDVIRVTRIVTKTTRGKLVTNIPIDADTPSMGVWVKNMEVVQVSTFNHSAVAHDTTLTGTGRLSDPLGVTPAAFGKIKDIPTSISQFRTGDVIPVDGPNGPAKMSKDDLLTETAQNALAGNIAPEFDPTRTSENPYTAGESVTYTDSRIYTFKVDHYGAWNSNNVQATDEFWRYSFPGACYQDGFTISYLNQAIGPVQVDGTNRTLRVGCVPGQKFYIRAVFIGSLVTSLWCTFDEYGIVKRRSASSLDTRSNPAIITIEPGEYGIAFNVIKSELYFIACSVPNFIFNASNKLAELEFRTTQDSANTPIPFDIILDNTRIVSDGSIEHNTNYALYEYEVNPGSKINIKSTKNSYVAFYDDNGGLVGTPFNASTYTQVRVNYLVNVPATATRLKVTCVKVYDGVAQYPSVVSCDGFGMKTLIENQRQSEARIFEGKKILCIGDSITEGETWFGSLLRVTGAATIWNRGAGGTTLASYPGSTDSMCDRADLASNDSTSTSAGFPSDSNVDVIIVWGGTNDFGLASKNVQFGTEVKIDKMYFLSAVFYLINKLKIKYPTKPIYFCGIMTAQSPEGNQWSRYTITDGVYTERTNWTGKTVTEFNEAIKKISAMTGVHYIDMDRCGISPVNGTDYSAYFDTLGLHPNNAGGDRIGRYIAENLVYDS